MYFWVADDLRFQINVKAGTPLKRVDFFYNNIPHFTAKRININTDGIFTFKTQAELRKFNFLRCDVDENNKDLEDFRISIKSGVLSKNWYYNALPPKKMLLNDLIIKDNKIVVTGNDPFFVLTTPGQIYDIQWLIILRQHVYIFLCILLFVIALLLHRRLGKLKNETLFLAGIFLAVISFGLVFRLFNSDVKALLSERRDAKQLPVLQTDSVRAYTRELDNYLNDQLPGRNNIVISNNLAEYAVFGQLINNSIVHFGEDGWMFFIAGPCRENFENRHPLSGNDLKKMAEVLEARNQWLKTQGIKFYLAFPPTTHFIYEEKIGPRLWRYSRKSKLDQLLEYLVKNTDIDLIDLYHPIIAEKRNSDTILYYQGNSHWNYFGGYIAYKAIIERISKDFPATGTPIPLRDIRWVHDYEYTADLLKLLAINDFYSYHENRPLIMEKIKVDTIYPTYLGFASPAPPYIYVSSKKDCPSLMVYGDSFAGALMAYLPYNFSRIIGLWTPLLYPEIIEKEKPDIVIQEMADYTIKYILEKNPPLPAIKDTIPGKPE
jgi:alginate O-acetyltransferase complex protein AlgJ